MAKAKRPTMHRHTRWLLESIREAHARDRGGTPGMILRMELYCDLGSCPIRELEVHVKDFERDFLTMVEERGMPCPACGTPLKCHWVRARNEPKVPVAVAIARLRARAGLTP
jgi:hypothetical protein